MSVNTDVDICNMSLGLLGNFETITSIEQPTSDKEKVFALWYDVTRQALLKEMLPNFARKRKYVAVVDIPIPEDFGYQTAYEYPSDCLKVLGASDVDLKENNYSIEDGAIYTDVDYGDGFPLRYVADVSIVSKFTPEFKILLATSLAVNAGSNLGQIDDKKIGLLIQILNSQKMAAAGMNAQENRPVRIERSKFIASKTTDVSTKSYKR